MEDTSFDDVAMRITLPLSPIVQDMSFEMNDNWDLTHQERVSNQSDNLLSKNKSTRISSLVYDDTPGRDIVSSMTSSTYQSYNDDDCSQESKDSGIYSDVSSSPFANICSFSPVKLSNSSPCFGAFTLDSSSNDMTLSSSISQNRTTKCKRRLAMPSNAGSHSKIRRKLNLAAGVSIQYTYDDKENTSTVLRSKEIKSLGSSKRLCYNSPPARGGNLAVRRGHIDVPNTFDDNRDKTNGKLGRCFTDITNIHTQDHLSEEFIKEALDQSEEETDPIGDFSAQHVLPVIRGRHKDLKSITHDTMSAVLRHEYSDVIGELTIVDARYPYEYSGGHIEGAKNLSTEDSVLSELFEKTQHPSTSTKRNVLIVHCEFSIERGPKLLRFLRSHDRDVHKDSYPQLSYPEIYLLEDGYKSFYMSHPQLCSPAGYRPMLHPDYTEDLRRCRSEPNTSGDNKRQARRKNKTSRTAVLHFDL